MLKLFPGITKALSFDMIRNLSAVVFDSAATRRNITHMSPSGVQNFFDSKALSVHHRFRGGGHGGILMFSPNEVAAINCCAPNL